MINKLIFLFLLFSIVEASANIKEKIIQNLENQKNLEESLDEYQKLIRLNNLIEKKFQKSSKEISESAKFKINEISIKNAKKIK